VDTVVDDNNTKDASALIHSITRVANSVLPEVTGDVNDRAQDAENASSRAVDDHRRGSEEAGSSLSRFSGIIASVTRSSSYPERTGNDDDDNEDYNDDNDSASSGLFVPRAGLIADTFLVVLGLL
jgi:hypothetical protein